jgi:hypothetical protein
MRADHEDGRFVHFDKKNNPQNDHQLKQTLHKSFPGLILTALERDLLRNTLLL